MKPRRVVILMEVETTMPMKALRESSLYIDGDHVLNPVNKPKVEVIRQAKSTSDKLPLRRGRRR